MLDPRKKLIRAGGCRGLLEGDALKVLVACEYSGRVRRAFSALGHDVMSADYEPAEDNSQNHYQGDCFDLINDQHFDLMIAHPHART